MHKNLKVPSYDLSTHDLCNNLGHENHRGFILPRSFTKTHTVYLEITILFNITGLRQSNNFSWKEILTIIDLNLIIIYFNQRSDITLTNSSEADTCIASRAPSVSRNTSVLPVFLHTDTLVNLIYLNSLHDLFTSRYK